VALAKQPVPDLPSALASRISEALLRERVVPRFVASYIEEHGRYALQVHAPLYRDLLGLLQREALLAATARALELSAMDPLTARRQKPRPLPRKEVAGFRRKFLTSLARLEKWTAGDAVDFQNDLQMYEELLERVGAARRRRKPFEAANHPFVDRCAFLLDSSFLEKARLAASRALAEVEALAERAFAETGAGTKTAATA
jgi:hypothetical protein